MTPHAAVSLDREVVCLEQLLDWLREGLEPRDAWERARRRRWTQSRRCTVGDALAAMINAHQGLSAKQVRHHRHKRQEEAL